MPRSFLVKKSDEENKTNWTDSPDSDNSALDLSPGSDVAVPDSQMREGSFHIPAACPTDALSFMREHKENRPEKLWRHFAELSPLKKTSSYKSGTTVTILTLREFISILIQTVEKNNQRLQSHQTRYQVETLQFPLWQKKQQEWLKRMPDFGFFCQCSVGHTQSVPWFCFLKLCWNELSCFSAWTWKCNFREVCDFLSASLQSVTKSGLEAYENTTDICLVSMTSAIRRCFSASLRLSKVKNWVFVQERSPDKMTTVGSLPSGNWNCSEADESDENLENARKNRASLWFVYHVDHSILVRNA